jgi:transcriptional regulator with PAS, ATPase and Fis domain
VLSSLLSYGWPGNVRELKHAIERAVLVAHDGVVRICDIPSEITHPVQGNTNSQSPQIARMDLKAGERQMIERVLAEHQGNRMATATVLNISVSTLWRKMRRHQLL